MRMNLIIFSIVGFLISSASALYSQKDAVIQLTPANWKHEVNLSKAPEYKKAAESLQGLAKVAAVDCDDHKELCGKYGIKGFPTIKIFGSDKAASPIEYNQERNAGSLVDAVIPLISDALVTQIGNTANRVKMDEFIAKELPKVVLFNKKYGIPPLFKALAIDFEGKISFGEVKSTDKDLTSLYNVSEFPSVLIFNQGESNPIKYEGQMKHAALLAYFKTIIGEKSSSDKIQEEKFDSSIPEIKSQDDLKKECVDENILCVVAFLNLESDYEESRKAYEESISILQNTKLKNKSKLSSFKLVWVNAIDHGRQLIQDTGMSDILPGILALHVKRSFYRNYRGAFDQSGIDGFVSDVMLGRGTPNVRLNFDVQLDRVKTEL